MSKSVVQPPRHAVPKRTQVLGVATAEILRCANVLRWRERGEEVVVGGTEERTFAVDSRLANYARLVNVEVLERIVEDAVGRIGADVTGGGTGGGPLGH